jgi:hypothetical protein
MSIEVLNESGESLDVDRLVGKIVAAYEEFDVAQENQHREQRGPRTTGRQ